MTRLRKYGSGAPLALALALICTFASLPEKTAAQDAKSRETPAGNAENGKRIFVKHGCYQCHGREGQGSSMTGPRIAPDPVPFDVFARYLRRPLGEMPVYTAKVVPDQELADIYAYLQSRPHPPAAKNIPLLK